MTAESEYKYRKEMETYNKLHSDHEIGYFDYEGGYIYQNYFAYVMNHVKGHAGHEFTRLQNSLK